MENSVSKFFPEVPLNNSNGMSSKRYNLDNANSFMNDKYFYGDTSSVSLNYPPQYSEYSFT